MDQALKNTTHDTSAQLPAVEEMRKKTIAAFRKQILDRCTMSDAQRQGYVEIDITKEPDYCVEWLLYHAKYQHYKCEQAGSKIRYLTVR